MQKNALRGQTGNHSKVAEGGELKEGGDSYRTSLSRANWQTKQIGGAQLKEVERGVCVDRKLSQVQNRAHCSKVAANPNSQTFPYNICPSVLLIQLQCKRNETLLLKLLKGGWEPKMQILRNSQTISSL